MSETVCAVVVTYNRKNLLREGLQNLLQQRRPLDAIVVVNNKSTDDTAEMLANEFPQIPVVHLPENLGGAGGFHHGVKWAHERGFDWIWVMDDDVEAFPGTLEKMLSYRDVSEFIHVRRAVDDKTFVWEGTLDLSSMTKLNYPREFSFENGREWTTTNVGNFEGALFSNRIVDRIGYPDIRFFIGGDDTIYGFLASFHTNVIYVNHIGLRRKTANRPPDRRGLYFGFRNRFLIYEYVAGTGIPVSRFTFWLRMLQEVFWNLREQQAVRTYAVFRGILEGIRDGRKGRYGRPTWMG